MKTLTKVLLSALLSSIALHYFLGVGYILPIFVHFVLYLGFLIFVTVADALMIQTASDDCVKSYEKRVEEHKLRVFKKQTV